MRFFRLICTLTASLLTLCPSLDAKERKGDALPAEGEFLEQLHQRDSILIGDQLRYGFRLDAIPDGTRIHLPEWSGELSESVEIIREWQTDTIRVHKQKKGHPALLDLESYVTLTSFDEGLFELPPISISLIYEDGVVDTREFESQFLDVKTMPVDTATFVVHELKGQIRYPVTFKELLPWILGFLGVGALIAALVYLVVWIVRRRRGEDLRPKEPAHIVALRKLDSFRGEKYWEPDKQKFFYTGVTDALREYICSRYEVSAMEMTTAEIFDSIKDREISPELYNSLKDLFERSDFVKFAKHAATKEENASAVPLAVRFVTETYQREIEEETKK